MKTLDMRFIFPMLLCCLLGNSLSAQQLSTFVNTQDENGVVAIRSDFNNVASYGEQFAVVYSVTDATVGSFIPQLSLFNEDGTLDETLTFPAVTRANLNFSANSPDRTKAWFFGTVAPAPGSNQQRDIGILYGDEDGFTHGSIDLGYSELVRGGAATDSFLYLVTTVADGVETGVDYTVLKIDSDFTILDSMQLPAMEGLFVDYVRASDVSDFVHIAFRGDQGISAFRGANLMTNTIVEYTFPTLANSCNSVSGERFIRRNGGVTSPVLGSMFAVTTCGSIYAFLQNGGVNELTGNVNILPSEFGAKLFFLAETQSTADFLLLESGVYQKFTSDQGNISLTEAGEYTDGEFVNADFAVLNTNDKLLQVQNNSLGEFKIATQGVPGAWIFQPADSISLPTRVNPGTALRNVSDLEGEVYAVLRVDSLSNANTLQQFNPITGAITQSIFPEDNLGLSEPQRLDNGNLVLGTLVRNDNFTADAQLIEVNPNTSAVTTLASDLLGNAFEGSLWQRLEKLSNGDLLFITTGFNAFFTPNVQVRRFTQTGELLFTTTLPDSVAAGFVYGAPTLDADDNLYLLSLVDFGTAAYRVTSVDADGNIRYVTRNETPGFEMNSFSNHRIFFNESGEAFLTSTFFDGDMTQAVLAEVDPATGEQLSFTPLAPDLFTQSIMGDFIPGTDSLVLFHTYFDNEGSNAAAPYLTRVLFLDEALTVFWEQEILAARVFDQFLLDDFAVAQSSAYATGRRFVEDLDATFATIIGINFSDLAAVVSVDDFTAATQLKVFPNPTANRVNLKWEAQGTGTFQLEVLNVAGQTLLNRSGQMLAGQNLQGIDVANLPSGTYYLRLVTPMGTTVQPIVKE